MCYSEGLAMPTIHAEHANDFHHTSRSARSRNHLTAEMNKRMDMQREANYYMRYSEGLAMPTIHAEHANDFHHTSRSALSSQ